MISVDDYELLARAQAGDLSHDERARLEARLQTEPELAEAWQQLQALEAHLNQLPTSEPNEATERLVRGAVNSVQAVAQRRGWRSSGVAAVAALVLAVMASVAFQNRGGVARATVIGGLAKIDGRSRTAGDVVTSPRHLVTGDLGLVALTGASSLGSLWLGPHSELDDASDTPRLRTGAVLVRAQGKALSLADAELMVSGEAVLSAEPLAPSARVTANLTPEQFVKLERRQGLAAAGVATLAALSLYVLQGSVTVTSGGHSSVVTAPNTWFGAKVDATSAGALIAEVPPDAGLVAARAAAGVVVVRVTAADVAVANAVVKLYPLAAYDSTNGRQTWGRPVTASSDAKGFAEFSVPPGAFAAVVARAGWATAGVTIHHAEGAARTEAEVTLTRGVRLVGVTQDATTHKPVVPASVTLRSTQWPDDEAATVDVDPTGHFAFEHVAPSQEVSLQGSAPGFGPAELKHVLPTEGLVVAVVFHATGFVEGYVHLPDGGAANGASVWLVGDDTVKGETSPSGSFSLEAPLGHWRAQARLGELVGRAGADIVAVSGKTISVGVITLEASSTLSGRVMSADAGVARMAVVVSPHLGVGEITRGETDAKGAYSLPLASGVYDLEVQALDTSGDSSAEAPSASGVHVAGATRFDFVIPAPGAIHGEVVDPQGRKIEGELVQLQRGGRPVKTLKSADGTFVFERLAPGTWVVALARTGQPVNASMSVRVESGQTAEAHLVVQPLGQLDVSVAWRCAGPPRPVSITPRIVRNSFLPTTTLIVPAGAKELHMALPPQEYLLGASTDDETCFGRATVEVEAEHTAHAVLQLTDPPVIFDVLTLDASGQPTKANITVVDAANPAEILNMGISNDEGHWLFRDFFVDRSWPPSKPFVVLANAGFQVGKSPALAPSTKSVTVSMSKEASLRVHLQGMTEPHAKVGIVTTPSYAFQDFVETATADFAIESLPAGTLHLTVNCGDHSGEAEVTLQPSETGEVNIQLSEGGVVRGHLVDRRGQPRAGWVGLIDLNGQERASAVQADDRGVFVLKPVPAGSFIVAVMGQNSETAIDRKVPVTVKPGVVTDVGEIKTTY